MKIAGKMRVTRVVTEPNPPRTSDDEARTKAFESMLAEERDARAVAEAASNAKSELLTTVSHEVRAPLGAIISMADLLLKTPLIPRQRHYADTLQQSGRALLAVLNEVLDFSKLEAGRLRLEAVRFDFLELMKSVEVQLAARAGDKGIAARVELADDFPRHMLGDPVRIRQILNNLTDNALKFTDAGSVRVRVGYGHDGDEIILRFEVWDTGVGLTEQQMSRLFPPQPRSGSSVAGNLGGAGLGLSISSKLVNLMSGDLGCESAPDMGSMFWFTIRVGDAESAAWNTGVPERVPPSARRAVTAPLEGHVLVVEDNDINQILISTYLDQFGLTHDTAVNGQEAVQMVQMRHYDIVLMDIMMPVMDGLEATQHIRKDDALRQVPIIMLTTSVRMKDVPVALAYGADAYIAKPQTAEKLIEKVQAILA